MLVNIQRFIETERSYWEDLNRILEKRERSSYASMTLSEIRTFNYLYRRACTDLVRLRSDAAETSIQRYLESLVSRAFKEIHCERSHSRFKPVSWFFRTFPQTFRRHSIAFLISCATVIVGAVFGSGMLVIDSEARSIILPGYLQMSPSERVHVEETTTEDRLKSGKATFSSYLMTHNIRISLFTFALGITFGVGTLIMLFYNGIILGAVIFDYILGGEIRFLIAWLLPHGSIEIPAMLIAGQTGFVLTSALIGRGKSISLNRRLRQVSKDLITLICGCALMLIWAGIIESFFSQYHEPFIPYYIKIAFGVIEVVLLFVFLSMAGRKSAAGLSTNKKRTLPELSSVEVVRG